MGGFVNSGWLKVLSAIITLIIIGLNLWLIGQTIRGLVL